MGVEDCVVEASEPPHAAAQQQAEADCQTDASRVQKMMSPEPAMSLHSAALQPSEAGYDCLTVAHRMGQQSKCQLAQCQSGQPESQPCLSVRVGLANVSRRTSARWGSVNLDYLLGASPANSNVSRNVS